MSSLVRMILFFPLRVFPGFSGKRRRWGWTWGICRVREPTREADLDLS